MTVLGAKIAGLSDLNYVYYFLENYNGHAWRFPKCSPGPVRHLDEPMRQQR